MKQYYKKLAQLNAACFGKGDEMSKAEKIQEFDNFKHHGIEKEIVKGEIVGYVLWYITHDNYITIYRRGVSKTARGLGLGVKLTDKVIAKGKEHGVDFWTYAARNNLPSINSSIKAGCKIHKINDLWVELIRKL